MSSELSPHKVVKNTTYITLALTAQKALSFLYFIFLARLLSPEDIGKYVFAMAFTTIFTIAVDLGLSQVLTREIAKDHDKTTDYLSSILGLKVFLSLGTVAAIAVLINLLGYPSLTKQLVYLASVVTVVDSWQVAFYAVFRGWQNLKYEALGMSLGQVLIVTVGLVGVYLGAPLHILVIAVLTGSVFNFLLSFILLKNKLGIAPHLRLNKDILKILFKIALPFALYGIFTKVHDYLDTVLLSKLAGDAPVAWYGIASKATFALQFIPAAFAASLFPAMSHYFVQQKEMLARTFERAVFYLMIIALPVSVGIIALANEIITNLYTDKFIHSILPLQILIAGLVFIFLNYPVGSLLNACNKQKVNTINMGIVMIVSAVLNIILIPRLQAVGAALTALSTGFLLFGLGLFWVGKIINFNKKFLFLSLFKTLLAVGLMAGAILYLKPMVSWLLLIPLGALVYCLTMWLTRAVTREDVVLIFAAIFRRTNNL